MIGGNRARLGVISVGLCLAAGSLCELLLNWSTARAQSDPKPFLV